MLQMMALMADAHDNLRPHGGLHLAPSVARERAIRQHRQRPQAEYLKAKDIARILPFSVSQITAMAAQPGSLPGFKLPGCALWLFDETVVRAWMSIYINGCPAKGVTPCRSRKMPTQIAISRSVKASGTSATSSEASPSGKHFQRLMSSKRGNNATES